jgi:hypothetical protein
MGGTMNIWIQRFVLVLALALCPSLASAATIKQLNYETITSAMTTELNSVANNSRVISSALGADATAANLLGDWELAVTYGTNPTVDTCIDLYLVRAADGTNYEDGDASIRPGADSFAGCFQVRAVTTAQRMVIRDVPMPPGLYKAVIHNNGTGQTFAASGNTLKVRTHNRQVQ